MQYPFNEHAFVIQAHKCSCMVMIAISLEIEVQNLTQGAGYWNTRHVNTKPTSPEKWAERSLKLKQDKVTPTVSWLAAKTVKTD